MKKRVFLSFSVLLAIILSGCMSASDGIGVSKSSRHDKLEYYSLTGTMVEGLSFDTRNYLSGNLLYQDYKQDPLKFSGVLFYKFLKTRDPELLSVTADIIYNMCLKARSQEDKMKYALASGAFYYYLIFNTKSEKNHLFQTKLNSIIRYNVCTSIVLRYCIENSLLFQKSYEFSFGGRCKIVFPERPLCTLRITEKTPVRWFLCSDYHPENLFYFVQRFGVGVPLIANLQNREIPGSVLFFEKDITLPATAFLRFEFRPNSNSICARFEILDSERAKIVRANNEVLPLASDFTTPLAWEIEQAKKVNLILMTRNADKLESGQLIATELYDPKKIPVIFIHGLLSSKMTWLQLLNILRSNDEIREKYQFWYYQYSSGNPVFASSAELRSAVDQLRKEIVRNGADVSNFDKMVLIGHSMGGLIARTFAAEGGDIPFHILLDSSFSKLKKDLKPEEITFLEKYLVFKSKPYVRRIVFMAVPHKGSEMATGLLAKVGSSLIRHPRNLLNALKSFGENFIKSKRKKVIINGLDFSRIDISTGVKDLAPQSRILKVLNAMPLSKNIVYHSIIGNADANALPGGSDGIVPYSSSHINEAASELIIKSGHSVHKHPKAIHELERILLLHLKECK